MSGEELLVAITAAGATLKQAKTEKKSKAELQPLIETLLGLKAEYKAATGEDPPSAPKGPSKKDKKKKVEPKPAAGDAAAAPAAAGDTESSSKKAEKKAVKAAAKAEKQKQKDDR
jgi:bifunctional glutamyl/prolyl-tRNA synthetase